MDEALHGIGMVLGFCGAMVSCGLMLRLKDDETRRRRGRLARRVALATATGLLLLLVSGVLLSAHHSGPYPTWLLVKHAFVAVIVVDAVLIHFLFFPRYFRQIGSPEFEGTYGAMRRVGALSALSWLVVLALSFARPAALG